MKEKIRQKRQQLELAEKLSAKMHEKLNQKRQRLELAAERLAGLSPIERLQGGYSVASKEGRVVKELSQVSTGDELCVDVTDGTILTKVTGTQKR